VVHVFVFSIGLTSFRDVRNAARVVGDPLLYEKMEKVSGYNVSAD
jgi:hypothetical protein